MERVDLTDDQLVKLIGRQLEREGQEARNAFAKRKVGIEKVMAAAVVQVMRRQGMRVDAPKPDPESAIVGRAYPE